jgi:glycine hydroxymethyltransferase
MKDLQNILNLTRGHNQYLEERIDLVASNSMISSFARFALGSMLSNSYCIGTPGRRLYGGCSYIDMVEEDVMRLAKELFKTKFAMTQFLSGMQANIGAYNTLLEPGDKVVSAPAKHGGHYSHNTAGPLRFYSNDILSVPFNPETYNIDLEGLAQMFDAERPQLLVVGWSEFPFAHPLYELRSLCDAFNVKLMYDMSHVAGLIAGGEFQPEAGQLADVVTSSTGKSLHAPDHGMLLYNESTLDDGIHDALMPLLTSNTHPHELAALGVVFAEMKEFGPAYAKQVIANSKALGAALKARGVKALYGDLGFSDSHTLLIEYPHANSAVALLDEAGISANTCPLPWDTAESVTGLRIGTQVVTRRGMKQEQMELIADAIARVLLEADNPRQVQRDIIQPLASSFNGVAYSFDDHFALGGDWQHRGYSPSATASTGTSHAPMSVLH